MVSSLRTTAFGLQMALLLPCSAEPVIRNLCAREDIKLISVQEADFEVKIRMLRGGGMAVPSE
jgi:hypothetical protein